MASDGGSRAEAQQAVLAALREVQESVVAAGDSVQYLGAEVALLEGKMRSLESSAALFYPPFRERCAPAPHDAGRAHARAASCALTHGLVHSLIEYAAADKQLEASEAQHAEQRARVQGRPGARQSEAGMKARRRLPPRA